MIGLKSRTNISRNTFNRQNRAVPKNLFQKQKNLGGGRYDRPGKGFFLILVFPGLCFLTKLNFVV